MNVRRAALLLMAVSFVGSLMAQLLPEPTLSAATQPLGAGAPDRPDTIRVLYPPDGAIVTTSPAVIMILATDIATPPAFRLDGTALELEKIAFADAWKAVPAKIPVPVGSDDLPLRSSLLEDKDGKVIWVAAKDLPEGKHVVTLDGVPLTAFSVRQPRPAGANTGSEPVLRVHGSPGSPAEALDCAQCHGGDDADDVRTLGVARTPEACHSCHDDVDLSLSHEHLMEDLAKCQMCHDPHAATRPKLLIDTRETVCAMCHESGYAR
jgi:predicted CXXCH cytochrome family protein